MNEKANYHYLNFKNTGLDRPFTTKIKRITQQSADIKTIYFEYSKEKKGMSIEPGQFLMIWVPGTDEIPMAVSHSGNRYEIGITVKNVGEATDKLHQMSVGDYIGVRGPYGNGFQVKKNGFSIVISGGVGAASVRLLIMKLIENNPDNLLVINGALSKNELLFLTEFKNLLGEDHYFVCTDDGSLGYHGFTVSYLEENLKKIIKKYGNSNEITIYTCGPEIMMKKIFKLSENYGISIQASLERVMRCGFGLCGLCVLDPTGHKVCQDGPVFDSDKLKKITDFGKFKRTFTGEKIKE